LARRVAVNQQTETTAIILQEGQPPLRIQAAPLRPNPWVLLIGQPASGSTNPHLSRLMAHELRTPLTAIVGHAGILAGCTPADEALWRRSRDFIAAEAARLARLVEDWLTLSRLDAAPPLTRPVNLRRLAENTLAAQFDRAEAAGLTLTLKSPPTLPRVCADPDRIEQALVNLVDNAIKYTPAGGAVSLQLASEGGYVRVQVSDTGPGIAPDDLPHLFEPLYRADSVRRLPGAGLGLTIVRAILDQHGVSISIHSPPGHGATFTFRLSAAR
jgi:two-component system phosphate regulon sensor histidine kinase PhoR